MADAYSALAVSNDGLDRSPFSSSATRCGPESAAPQPEIDIHTTIPTIPAAIRIIILPGGDMALTGSVPSPTAYHPPANRLYLRRPPPSCTPTFSTPRHRPVR